MAARVDNSVLRLCEPDQAAAIPARVVIEEPPGFDTRHLALDHRQMIIRRE
jgi:hypothetical protein